MKYEGYRYLAKNIDLLSDEQIDIKLENLESLPHVLESLPHVLDVLTWMLLQAEREERNR